MKQPQYLFRGILEREPPLRKGKEITPKMSKENYLGPYEDKWLQAD